MALTENHLVVEQYLFRGKRHISVTAPRHLLAHAEIARVRAELERRKSDAKKRLADLYDSHGDSRVWFTRSQFLDWVRKQTIVGTGWWPPSKKEAERFERGFGEHKRDAYSRLVDYGILRRALRELEVHAQSVSEQISPFGQLQVHLEDLFEPQIRRTARFNIGNALLQLVPQLDSRVFSEDTRSEKEKESSNIIEELHQCLVHDGWDKTPLRHVEDSQNHRFVVGLERGPSGLPYKSLKKITQLVTRYLTHQGYSVSMPVQFS